MVTAAKAMKPMIGPETLVIPLQNGVEAPALLMQELPEKMSSAVCALIAFQASPGHIKHWCQPMVRLVTWISDPIQTSIALPKF